MGKCDERQMCHEGCNDVARCSIDYFCRCVHSTKEFTGHMSGIKSKLCHTLGFVKMMSESRLRSCYFCHQCDEMYSYVGACSLGRSLGATEGMEFKQPGI